MNLQSLNLLESVDSILKKIGKMSRSWKFLEKKSWGRKLKSGVGIGSWNRELKSGVEIGSLNRELKSGVWSPELESGVGIGS